MKPARYSLLRMSGPLSLHSRLAVAHERSCASQLEECLICMMYFPALNRSRCCKQSICTDCYLQACYLTPQAQIIHPLAKLKRNTRKDMDF